MNVIHNKCTQKHYLVGCEFNAHIPRVKKHKLSSGIYAWKLRDLDSARWFHATFSVKARTTVVAVASAAAAIDSAYHVDFAWPKLKCPLLNAATKFWLKLKGPLLNAATGFWPKLKGPLLNAATEVCPRTTSEALKPGGGKEQVDDAGRPVLIDDDKMKARFEE